MLLAAAIATLSNRLIPNSFDYFNFRKPTHSSVKLSPDNRIELCTESKELGSDAIYARVKDLSINPMDSNESDEGIPSGLKDLIIKLCDKNPGLKEQVERHIEILTENYDARMRLYTSLRNIKEKDESTVKYYSDEFEVPELTPIIIGQIWRESRGVHRDESGGLVKSKSGALGLMGLMEYTADEWSHKLKNMGYDVDWHSRKGNTAIAIAYLSYYCLDGMNGDLIGALRAYNLGKKKLEEWTGGLEDKSFETLKSVLPEETLQYPAGLLAASIWYHYLPTLREWVQKEKAEREARGIYDTPLREDQYEIPDRATLTGIAEYFGITKEEILENNSWIQDEGFQAGRVLSGLPKRWELHIVKKDENLYRIGKKYNTGWEHLMTINDLENEIINVGQVIKVPIKNPT